MIKDILKKDFCMVSKGRIMICRWELSVAVWHVLNKDIPPGSKGDD